MLVWNKFGKAQPGRKRPVTTIICHAALHMSLVSRPVPAPDRNDPPGQARLLMHNMVTGLNLAHQAASPLSKDPVAGRSTPPGESREEALDAAQASDTGPELEFGKKSAGAIWIPSRAPRSIRLWWCRDGMKPRSFQPCTVDGCLWPSSRARAVRPPNFSMITSAWFMGTVYTFLAYACQRGKRMTSQKVLRHD
jgi:hypothetical protein